MSFVCGLCFLFPATLQLSAQGASRASVAGLAPAKAEYVYNMYFSFFKIGESTLREESHSSQGKHLRDVSISVKTTGLTGFFSKIEDFWSAKILRDGNFPVSSLMSLKEGKYRYKEELKFDYDAGQLKVKKTNKHGDVFRQTYPMESAFYDLVGAIQLIRFSDFEKWEVGQELPIRIFYGGKFYDCKVVYEGKEMVKTDFGRINAYRVIPEIPPGPLFKGERPIVCLVSADRNRIVLHMKARIKYGKFSLDLVEMK